MREWLTKLDTRRPRQWTLLLFAVAMALRVAVAAWQGLPTPAVPGSDESEYMAYATSLAFEHEFRGPSPDVADQHHLTAYRPPGTSFVYAVFLRIFGPHVAVVRLANCLWGALACVLLLAIGRELSTERIAWLVAALWAIYPRALLFSGALMSESLGLLTFLTFMLYALRFAKSPRLPIAALAGVWLGIAILVHAGRLFMVPFVILWALIIFWRRWPALLNATMIPVIAGLTVLPWTIRNYLVLHEPIPLSTAGGSALLQGNNRIVVTDPKYYGYSVWDTFIPEYADSLRHAGDEVTRDRMAGRFAKQWLKANTRYWPFLFKAKLIRGFTPLLQPQSGMLYRSLELVMWGPILLLLLIGFVPTWRQMARARNGGWLIHFAILHFVVITVLFFGNSRYRYPVEPLCLLIAVMTVAWLLGRGRGESVPVGAAAPA